MTIKSILEEHFLGKTIRVYENLVTYLPTKALSIVWSSRIIEGDKNHSIRVLSEKEVTISEVSLAGDDFNLHFEGGSVFLPYQ